MAFLMRSGDEQGPSHLGRCGSYPPTTIIRIGPPPTEFHVAPSETELVPGHPTPRTGASVVTTSTAAAPPLTVGQGALTTDPPSTTVNQGGSTTDPPPPPPPIAGQRTDTRPMDKSVARCLLAVWAFAYSFSTPLVLAFYSQRPRVYNNYDLITLIFVLLEFFALSERPNNPVAWMSFTVDAVASLPYMLMFKRHPWSSLSLLRVYRFRKAFLYLRDWEIDLDADYYWRSFVRVIEIITVTYSWVHAEGCVFYYIAAMEELHGCRTWLGCLQLGPYGYHHFTTLTVGGRYLMSVYYAMITIFTIGYGDAHPITALEIGFVIAYIIPNAIVVGYVGVKIAELIAKLRNA